MGTLRSKTNRTGLTVNGVTLGDPATGLIDGTAPQPGDMTSDLYFVWNDPAFPTGNVHADGTVDIDPAPEDQPTP